MKVLRALGLVSVLVAAYREKRTRDTGAKADIRSWMGANVTFYSAVLITLAFVPSFMGRSEDYVAMSLRSMRLRASHPVTSAPARSRK